MVDYGINSLLQEAQRIASLPTEPSFCIKAFQRDMQAKVARINVFKRQCKWVADDEQASITQKLEPESLFGDCLIDVLIDYDAVEEYDEDEETHVVPRFSSPSSDYPSPAKRRRPFDDWDSLWHDIGVTKPEESRPHISDMTRKPAEPQQEPTQYKPMWSYDPSQVRQLPAKASADMLHAYHDGRTPYQDDARQSHDRNRKRTSLDKELSHDKKLPYDKKSSKRNLFGDDAQQKSSSHYRGDDNLPIKEGSWSRDTFFTPEASDHDLWKHHISEQVAQQMHHMMGDFGEVALSSGHHWLGPLSLTQAIRYDILYQLAYPEAARRNLKRTHLLSSHVDSSVPTIPHVDIPHLQVEFTALGNRDKGFMGIMPNRDGKAVVSDADGETDLASLASKIKRIFDDEARRFGIDV